MAKVQDVIRMIEFATVGKEVGYSYSDGFNDITFEGEVTGVTGNEDHLDITINTHKLATVRIRMKGLLVMWDGSKLKFSGDEGKSIMWLVEDEEQDLLPF